MKRNWLLYLVIFSLALNLGTIGTLVYLRYHDQRLAAASGPLPPLPLRELWGGLNLDAAQRQTLRKLSPEHRRRVHEARGELAQKRQELFDLIRSEAPQWGAIQAKVREISALQGKLEEELVRFLLEVKKNLKPGQDVAFLHLMQGRMGPMCEPRGPGRGPMGRGPGPMHGGGMGPPPGPPPGSPNPVCPE